LLLRLNLLEDFRQVALSLVDILGVLVAVKSYRIL
jgi:hypothetical protein